MDGKNRGEFQGLVDIVQSIRNIIDVTDNDKQKQIRTEDGAVINWYPGTGTVQLQGNQDARSRLDAELSPLLGGAVAAVQVARTTVKPIGSEDRKVFVVYGHDQPTRDQLENRMNGVRSFIVHKD